MYISSLNYLLRSRIYNKIIPLIYNECHYVVFGLHNSSFNFIQQNKPNFIFCQSLAYSDYKLLGEIHNSQSRITSHSVRFKSSKSKRSRNQGDEDSDEESEDEEEWILEKGKNFKDLKVRIPTLRIDAVLKAGLGVSRSKAEEMFYGGKIKLNSSKPKKKSIMLQVDDYLDVVNEESNSSGITRIKVLKIGEYDEASDKFLVLIRKYPKLHPRDVDNEDNE